MKAAFSVESEGFDENEEQDRENLLQDFIEYIKVTAIRLKEYCNYRFTKHF